jgi:hypothetical protein
MTYSREVNTGRKRNINGAAVSHLAELVRGNYPGSG